MKLKFLKDDVEGDFFALSNELSNGIQMLNYVLLIVIYA